MRHKHRKHVLIALALSAQTTLTLAPAFAQESPDYAPDITSVEDIYSAPPANEVPTAQIPGGIFGAVFNVLGDKQDPGKARTINETQRKLLKAYDYGQKALNAYRLGKDLYQGINKIIKNPEGLFQDTLTAILDDYNKIGSNTPGADSGGEGPSEKIFDDPSTPAESYSQAKNDVARRMYLPSVMTQLVFSEDARTLREQQSTQLEDSITNTIEANQSLVQLSGGSVEAVAANGDLAKAVGEESANAQTLKSSQAVLKSLAAGQGIRAQQTATNGVILGSIQQSQVEQNKAATALVVSSALAYQQRDVQNHLEASQNAFLEQIRADLGQQEDERQLEKFSEIEKQANTANNILIPGLSSTVSQTDQ